MKIPLGITDYQSRVRPLLNERVVNLYAEQAPSEAKSEGALIGTPGFVLCSDISSDPVWGLHELNGILYAVVGDNFYSIDSSGVETNIGSIGAVSGNVQILNNGFQIMIIKPDTTAWSYTVASAVLAQITDADFPGATTGCYLSGIVVVSDPGTGQFFWSDVLDLTSWDALNFATAESSPDSLVAAFAGFGELWLFGARSTEVWYATGGAAAPLQRVNNGVIERGCAAKFSPAKDDVLIYWIGDDRVVYSAHGYTPNRISNHGIEKQLQDMTTIEDAIGFTYTQEGHKFYCLIFPTEQKTFVYDAITQLWHERESRDIGRWRANNTAFVYNRVLVGDYDDGKIYQLDLDTYTENGTIIERLNSFPPVFQEDKRIIFDSLYIDFETGVGLQVGQGSDPQVMLDWSDDGGYTFVSQKWRSMGPIGDRIRRCYWRRLGHTHERSFRFKITDPVKVHIMGAYVEMRVMEN